MRRHTSGKLLRQDCLVWTYLQLGRKKVQTAVSRFLFCFEQKYAVLGQGFFMPSSGSRPEGDLTTDLESPEMTQKASASANCNGTHRHRCPMDTERMGELSPQPHRVVLPPLPSSGSAMGLFWLAPVHTLGVVFCGQSCVFVCFLDPARICLFCGVFLWGGVKRVDNWESTYMRDRYWYLHSWDLDSEYLFWKMWIMLMLTITNRSAF